MPSPTSRLSDALWSLRREFGLGNDLDRIRKAIIFEQTLSQDRIDGLFIIYPKRVPEDYKSALLARIQEIVRQYWIYCSTRKGYHKIAKGIIFLENVARFRFEGCQLVYDKNTGYRLEIKPERLKK